MPPRKPATRKLAALTTKQRLAAVLAARTTRRYPYMLRGRVESAVFNCPRCNTWLKFRARTAFRKKCPDCQLVIYVFLRICVSAARGGALGRPVDTILPPLRADVAGLMSAGRATGPNDPTLIDPKQLEGDPFVARSIRAHKGSAPGSDEVALFVAELPDGSIDPMPRVGSGQPDEWRASSDRCHEVVDLDGADDES